ncbi:hypothetical protein V5T82_03865 [Magnetovibrio sp. PR-2]|uniref:hypothetical protein n=1 Tax=Magnetovibrio sp. PR-2 TaxID=3120356 RepID=UPI002FCE3DF2
MPKLIRFLLTHAAIGFTLGIIFVTGLMVLDVNGLKTLIWASDIWYMALFMITFFFGLTFGSVQIGVATMLLADEHQRGDGSGSLRRLWARARPYLAPPPRRELAPVPVKKREQTRVKR